jgi:acetyl-CoA carboxylase biotin carboxylase subunit
MEDEDYRRGDVSIQWLEQRLPTLTNADVPASETRLAAVAAALLADRDRGTPATADFRLPIPGSRDGWRDNARRDALR